MTASSLNSARIILGDAAGAEEVPRERDDAEVARWIAAAKDGCPDAFRALVERHQERIHRFCFHHLRNEGDAQEACQDTFVRAHRAIRGFRPKARFSTWLFQIALNLCRDRGRSRPAARFRNLFSLDPHRPEFRCGRATPDESAMRDADLARLDRGLAGLAEKQRTVLILSCIDGFSHRECAAILKCSERAVEGLIYRARRQLADWWERDGGGMA